MRERFRFHGPGPRCEIVLNEARWRLEVRESRLRCQETDKQRTRKGDLQWDIIDGCGREKSIYNEEQRALGFERLNSGPISVEDVATYSTGSQACPFKQVSIIRYATCVYPAGPFPLHLAVQLGPQALPRHLSLFYERSKSIA